ncbi:MAG TPA: hypothetical protein VFW83_03705 [Bryobacteraceae bacterium]|nr:hypothetical protein [Bryobacteraceae bacterium]
MLSKAVLAFAVVMGGVVALLLAGTQILDWYWLVLLAAVSLGAALYSLRGSIPAIYTLAQRIDRRLKLADALSTAIHFSEHPEAGRENICELQRRNAEEAARQVDVRTALPFHRPKYLLPAACLGAAALALFTARYLIIGSLDLKPSLVMLAYDSFFSTKSYEANNERPKRANLDPKAGIVPNDPSLQADVPPDQAKKQGDTPEANTQSGDDSKAGNQKNPPDSNKQSAGDPNRSAQDPPADSGTNKDAADPASSQAAQSAPQKNAPNGKNGLQSAGNQKSSLMDKLRDALADMMNKMNSSSQGAKSAQPSGQKAQPGDRPGEKANRPKDQQSQSAAATDQQGQDGEQKQSSDADNAKQPSDKNPAKSAKNGIGSQDGDKTRREAAEAQAMGKISEILGKRAANVSGEVMVEVGDTRQQLKTPWTQEQANHAEAGSEIDRDEVPLLYQPFVERYFEEIRKSEPASPARKAPVKK